MKPGPQSALRLGRHRLHCPCGPAASSPGVNRRACGSWAATPALDHGCESDRPALRSSRALITGTAVAACREDAWDAFGSEWVCRKTPAESSPLITRCHEASRRSLRPIDSPRQPAGGAGFHDARQMLRRGSE